MLPIKTWTNLSHKLKAKKQTRQPPPPKTSFNKNYHDNKNYQYTHQLGKNVQNNKMTTLQNAFQSHCMHTQ